MPPNLPVVARSLEEGRSIPFLRLRGERNTTPQHVERESVTKQHPSKTPKGGKRREKTTQSFVQRKQEQGVALPPPSLSFPSSAPWPIRSDSFPAPRPESAAIPSHPELDCFLAVKSASFSWNFFPALAARLLGGWGRGVAPPLAFSGTWCPPGRLFTGC
jgi:hypothetical protein